MKAFVNYDMIATLTVSSHAAWLHMRLLADEDLSYSLFVEFPIPNI